MKLYYAPGFSSMADHIAMLEAKLQFDLVKVDLRTKEIEDGGSYTDINPKGHVPALMFDTGELLTENAAILAWVADRAPSMAPQGELGRYRLIEMLSFLASEIYKRFPIYLSVTEESRAVIRGRYCSASASWPSVWNARTTCSATASARRTRICSYWRAARSNSGSRSQRAFATTWRASRHAPLCGRRNGAKRSPRLRPLNRDGMSSLFGNSTADVVGQGW